MSTARPNVYEYLAHGAFLLDMIRWMSTTHHHMSLRWVARRLNMSHGTLSKVGHGKQCLAEDKAAPIANLLHLGPGETEYFVLLVAKDSAVTEAAQAQMQRVVNGRRRIETARPLVPGIDPAMSNWLAPAVMELIGIQPDQRTPEQLAAMIRPKVSVAQVHDALDLLRANNLLPGEEGTVETSSTGHAPIGGVAFHQQMINLGRDALTEWPPNLRFVSGFTASVSEEGDKELRRRLQELVEVMLDLCERDEEADRVMQFNVQWFPLSTPHRSTDR